MKAIIIDDEYIVLEGLQKLINWEEYGIELAGTASDGTSGWQLYLDTRPDIVLTDIKMPVMNGLEVIEKIKETDPQTVCIVFSGFNEFEYVKKGLSLGILEYIEKPVTIPKVKDVLDKTMKEIGRQQEFHTMKEALQESEEELAEKALADLLHGAEEASGKWKPLLGERLAGAICYSVLVSKASLDMEVGGALRYVALQEKNNWTYVLLHNDAGSTVEWLKQNDLFLTAPVVGVGNRCKEVGGIAASYREAVKAWTYGQFMGEEGAVFYDDLPRAESAGRQLSTQGEAMILCLKIGSREKLLDQIERYRDWFYSQRFEKEVMENEILELLYSCMHAAKEMNGHKDIELIKDWRPHREIQDLMTREEVFAWFYDRLMTLFAYTTERPQEHKHASVQKALQYMEENYDQPLTLHETAEHVDLNATYFSVLFKEETGETYIKYLTRYRIKKAKEMLAEGEKTANVAAQVGYHTYRHFAEVFKKHTGVTPGEYKNSGA